MSASLTGRTPAWAGRMPPADFERFLSLVGDYFRAAGLDVDVDPAEGVLRPRGSAANTSFGLHNLAQACSTAEPNVWPGLVAAHFDAALKPEGNANPVNMQIGSLKDHAAQLRSRVYPESIAHYARELISRPGPPGTLEVLVLDLPGSVRTLAQSEASGWAVDAELLFEIGRRNLTEFATVNDQQVPLPLGAVLHLVSGDAFYAASHIFHVDNLLGAHARHGVLVAIPRRDVLLAHVIDGPTLSEALSAMIQAAHRMHEDGPGAIVPNLYWRTNGRFVDLPYTIDESALQFSPPLEFAELMQRLLDKANLS